MLVAIVSGLAVLAIGAAAKVALGRARTARERMTERIELVPPLGMGSEDGYRYALLIVREGRDEMRDAAALMNRTVLFREDGPGRLVATVRYRSVLGLQFKCFFDAPDPCPKLTELEEMVRYARWEQVSPDERAPGRYWFVLEKYPTCTTVEGYINNFLSFVAPDP